MSTQHKAVHVATNKRVYKGRVYVNHYLRRTYREDGQVKHETLGNLSHLPADVIEFIRARLSGGADPWSSSSGLQILRSLPHGHIAAVLGVARTVGLEGLLASRESRERDLIAAMVVMRVIAPSSKLATARALHEETATTSLGGELGLDEVADEEMYAALDWLLERQRRIEDKLADRHLEDGSLVLYDVSSSYYTGTHCSLARRGHSRDGKEDKIGERPGREIGRYKMRKHFTWTITGTSFSYQRNEESIAKEAALDGLYVVRTSVPEETFSPEQVVSTYKSLSNVERAFRSLKTVDLKIRPVYHRLDNRVRAHVFLCMLAYYVEWHMREKLAPILFDDEDADYAERLRESVVAPAQRSPRAKEKDNTKRTQDDLPVHSFRSLLQDLGTLVKNLVTVDGNANTFYVNTQPTELQRKAFDLLGVTA